MGGKKKQQIASDQQKTDEKNEKQIPPKKKENKWRTFGSKSQDINEPVAVPSDLKSRIASRLRRGSADILGGSRVTTHRRPSTPISPLPASPIFENFEFNAKHYRRRNTTPNGALAAGISMVLQNAFLNSTGDAVITEIPTNANNNGTGGGGKGKNKDVTDGREQTIEEDVELQTNPGMPIILKSGSTGSWESIGNAPEISTDDPGWRYPAENLMATRYTGYSKPTHRVSYRKAIQKAGYNMNDLALSNSSSASPLTLRRSEQKTKVDWLETASYGEHVWTPTSAAGDFCYVGELHCSKAGLRKKCAACRIVVHESCMDHLDKIGFQCKFTFREASTRNLRENLIVHHHWVHRRRQEGKCKLCGKVFEKRFGFRDSKILAISCSWCKEAYHNRVSCFRMQKLNEPCTLGVHARIIVPPTWIVKWTPRGKSVRNRSKKKRSSGTWRKKSSREGRQRLFVIRPLPEHTPYLSPTLVFINPKSGGNQGLKMIQTFQWLLNPRQVFNLSEGGPKEALEMFRKVPNLRILAAGGDGTIGWVLSVLDELNMATMPPVAILPIGTGNDLSRTLNWGPGYTDEPLTKILQHVEEAKITQLDRWKLTVTPNSDVRNDDEGNECAEGGVDQPPLHVVNNYFSLGADANVILEFHESREAHPDKFTSRFGNKMFYVKSGLTGYLTSKQKHLGKSLSLVCDGVDITSKILASKPVSIVFLNIPRYSAGYCPWGHPAGSEFSPQAPDDKLIEVIAFTANQLGMIFVGGHGERLCQCREAVITTTRTVPIQIDGEPCRLNPSVVRISFHNQANMLYKSKHRGSIPFIPDQTISEQLKVCVNVITSDKYEQHNGDRNKLRELSKPAHTTVVSVEADLESLRASIERNQQLSLDSRSVVLNLRSMSLRGSKVKNSKTISNNTIFGGKVSGSDRFYRIDKSQESMHLVREVATSDGELFVLDIVKSKVTKADLDTSLQLARFPRSQLVDRATRKRISSDTTGTNFIRQISVPELQPLISPGHISPITETAVEKSFTTADTKKTHFSSKVITHEVSIDNSNTVTQENPSEGTPTPTEEPDENGDVSYNGTPATVKQPLSHDDDVMNNNNASKKDHCDVIKTDSFPSVFSSPGSSKNQDSNSLCSGPSSFSTSSNEYLIIQEEGDLSPSTPMISRPFKSGSVSSSDSQTLIVNSSNAEDPKKLLSVPSLEIHDDSSDYSEEQEEEGRKVKKNNPKLKRGTARASVSMLPSSKKKIGKLKNRSDKAAGMSLSVFVKTQSPPPSQKLISPMKRKTHKSKSVGAQLTLNEFVTLNQTRESVSDGDEPKLSNDVSGDSHDDEQPENRSGSAGSTANPSDLASPMGGDLHQIDQSETINNNQSNNKCCADKQAVNKKSCDASKRGDLSKLKLAIESGADLFALDGDGSTVLHNAARFNHTDVVKYIIEKAPAELINITDRDRKQTALHKSAWFGHKNICEILVKNGASLTSVDYKGMTPLDRAQQAEDNILVEYLKEEAVKRMQSVLLEENQETDL